MSTPANKKFKNPRAKYDFKGRTCSIAGVGSYVPDRIITNADLESLVDTSDDWIVSRTGIKARRVAATHQFTSDLAAKAATRAMSKAGVKAEEIDLIIVATITPDMPFPSTACLVQQKIGAYRAAAFDIEAACSGFIFALEIGQQFIMSRTLQHSAGHRRGKTFLDRELDRPQYLRAVRRRRGRGHFAKPPERPRLADRLHGVGRSEGGFAFHARRRQPLSRQRGIRRRRPALSCAWTARKLSKTPCRRCSPPRRKPCAGANWTSPRSSASFPHQANRRIIDAVGERLGARPDQVFVNLDKYGNTSAASVAIALDEAVESKRIQRGDLILLVVFGAGLTWGAAVIEW